MAFDAAGAVGDGRPDDYLLSPVGHAAELGPSAPELAALLGRSRLLGLARQYEDADIEALAAQRKFRTWASRANWAVLVTATAGALLMAVALLKSTLGASTRPLLVGFAIFGVVSGAFASMALHRVKRVGCSRTG